MSVLSATFRSRRWIWILLGGCLGFLLGGTLLLLPPVQNWLLRKLVASQPGWKLEAEHIGINPLGLEARGLEFTMPGLRATTAPVSVRIAPSRFLRRELHIEQADVRRLELEITPAEMESSDLPFLGVLGELAAAVPLRWSLAQARVESRVDLRDAGQTLVSGDLTLDGGGVDPDRPGDFSYTLAAASFLLPPGEENRIHSTGTLRLQQDAAQVLHRIELDGDLRLPAYGPLELPAGRLHLVIAATPTGETYTIEVTLGDGTRFTYDGVFDRIGQGLTGSARLESDGTALAGLAPADAALPTTRIEATAEVDLDVASGAGSTDFTVDIEARDWAQLLPELAQLPALIARLEGTADLAADGTLRLMRGDATVADTAGVPRVIARTAGPLSLDTLPAETPLGDLQVSALPLTWFGGWTAPDATLTAGQLAAHWRLATDEQGRINVTPVAPLTIDDLRATVDGLPSLPAAWLQADLHATIDPVAMAAETRADLRLRAPDLWANLTRWRVEAHHTADTTTVDRSSLEIAPADQPPALELTLLAPVMIDHATASASFADADTARLTVRDFDLDWLTPWLPEGTTVAGRWEAGESLLRVAADGSAVELLTPVAWHLPQLAIAVSGQRRELELKLAPAGRFNADSVAGQLRIDTLVTDAGESLHGEVGGSWTDATAQLDLSADLNATVPVPAEFSAAAETVSVRIGLHAATLQENIQHIDRLELAVHSPDREWFDLHAPEGLLVARKPDGEFLFGAQTALELRLATLSLDWLRPWLPPETTIEGQLAAGDYLLFLEPQKFMLRARSPVQVSDLRIAGPGLPALEKLSARTHLSLDGALYHHFGAEFQLGFEGRIHATGGRLERDGKTVGEFDLGLGFMGNQATALARSLSTQGYVELAPLADLGVPEQGLVNFRVHGDLLGDSPLDAWVRLDELPSGAPPVELTAHGKVESDRPVMTGDFAVRVLGQRPSDLAFAAELSLEDGLLHFDSALNSRYFNVDDALAVAAVWPRSAPAGATPTRAEAEAVAETVAPDDGDTALVGPFWSALRGEFALDLAEVVSAPYTVRGLGGRMELGERSITLDDLRGEMFAGRWSGEFTLDFDAARMEAPYVGQGRFGIHQFETARAVQTVFPNEFGSLDARIDLAAELRSHGTDLFDLLDHSEASFSVEGRDGLLRLTHPDARTASTLLVLGGAISFSPELRALGRLLRKFAEMPVDDLRVRGERRADGSLHLNEVLIDSAQLRLQGRGVVPADDEVPLMGRPLQVAMDLAARDEMAVILGRMKLLEKKPGADGFQRMTTPLELGGEVGKPDPSPLYDLFARAVSGSRGTWGLIMRKVQKEVEKQRAKEAREAKS